MIRSQGSKAPPLLAAVLLCTLLLAPLHTTGQLPPLGDPLMGQQWGLDVVNATGAWQTVQGHEDIVVAVVDSGVDLTHLDLRVNLWDGNLMHGTSTARPFGVFENLPTGTHETTQDDVNHGTAIAGVIGAIADNGVGVRGMAQVPIMVVKVYGLGAPGHAEATAQGIHWAIDNGARIISISMSGSDHPALRAAVEHAWCEGAVIIAAGGNTGASQPTYPGRYPQVVSVGAIDETLDAWENSNRGVDLWAPGVDVLTTAPGNLYMERTGTSLSAPFVTGAAALVLAANDALSNEQVVQILVESAQEVQDLEGPVLDAGAAVDLAIQTTPSQTGTCGDGP